MQRTILLIAGWLAMFLALMGVLLPLLPTTPFLLLAAWCFARSSPCFHYWLLNRSWFASYLRHWQTHRALPVGARRQAIGFTVLSFAISLWLIKLLWLRIMLLLILAVLLWFMLRLPVIKDDGDQI